MHLVLQKRALRINEQVTLAALDLFATIVPSWSTHLSGFDRLAVDDRRCRLRRTADRTPIALPQDLGHVLPGASVAPLGMVIEDSIPGWILMRQQPPLGSGAQQIEDRIDDAPQRIGLPPPGRMAARDQGLEPHPLGIREIAGVGSGIHGGAPESSNSPHPP